MNGLIWIGLFSAISMLSPIDVTAVQSASQDDDWELAVDPARSLSVATARYDDGKAVVVQCAPVGLRVVLIGLPASTEPLRNLSATRADGRSDTQTWLAEPGSTVFTASVNGRDARFLRGGGLLQLRSPVGSASPMRAEFDMPTQNANLDRVLTDCGYSLDDSRDLISRAGDNLKSQWAADHAAEIARTRSPTFRRGGRSVSGGNPRRDVPAVSSSPPIPADLSCIIRNGALAECRLDHTRSSSPTDDERRIGFFTDLALEQVGAAANEGRVFYPGRDLAPIIVVQREHF